MAYLDNSDRRRYQREYYYKKTKPAREKQRGGPAREDKKLPVHLKLRASVVGRIMGLFHMGLAEKTMSHKNPSEFYGDLIVRGLESLRGNEAVDDALQYINAVSATDTIGAHRREAQAAFSRVKTEITELLQIKALEPARHYYWTTIQTFTDMNPNIWRDWFLREMATTFPTLAKSRPSRGVSLGDEGFKGKERRRKLRAVK